MEDNFIQKNVSLNNFTTYKTGGLAKYFVAINNIEDLLNILDWNSHQGFPIFVLGAGSNILISDKGFDGLVIKIQNRKFNIEPLTDDCFKITVGAGWSLNDLIIELNNNSLSSLDNLFGIPGSIGGSIRGNAGANNFEIKDNIISVANIDWSKLNSYNFEIKTYQNRECGFGYRDSIFKRKLNIIWEAEFLAKKCDQCVFKEKLNKIISKRIEAQPYNFPSAGCVFSNVDINKFPKEIQPDLLTNSLKQVPAGYLIDRCGLKGFELNGAKVSEKHANFIVNTGNTTSQDIYDLIQIIKQKVKENFGIDLLEEIQLIGFD